MSERDKIEAAGIRLLLLTDAEGNIQWRCRDAVVTGANGYYVALPEALFDALIKQFTAPAERGDEVERIEWKHGCDVILGYVTFWWPTVIACPHCGMPNPHAESARRGGKGE